MPSIKRVKLKDLLKRPQIKDLLRNLGPEFSARLLQPEQLGKILNDLGPEFSRLSDEGRRALCDSINEQFLEHQLLRKQLRDATPHKRMERWQQIERTTEKLQELILGFRIDLVSEIDRVRGHRRRPRGSPTQVDVPGKSFKIWSREAAEEEQRIEETLSNMVAFAQSGVDYNCKRKSSKRKCNEFHGIFISFIASNYVHTFKTKASARREGSWIVFLSRVLSILEGKETSPDAAYEAWLKVKKELAA